MELGLKSPDFVKQVLAFKERTKYFEKKKDELEKQLSNAKPR